MSARMCMHRCTPLCIKKVLGIDRELITTAATITNIVAFWDPPSGSKNMHHSWLSYGEGHVLRRAGKN